MLHSPTAADLARKTFLDALDACAHLSFGAPSASFVRRYRRAVAAALVHQPWLTEAAFRESFFRSATRLFGGAAASRYEQGLAAQVVGQGRRALAMVSDLLVS